MSELCVDSFYVGADLGQAGNCMDYNAAETGCIGTLDIWNRTASRFELAIARKSHERRTWVAVGAAAAGLYQRCGTATTSGLQARKIQIFLYLVVV